MENQNFERVAMRVSIISIVTNFVLTLIKIVIGFAAHSGAMISDAVHSASDVFSTIIVIIGIKIAAKDSDEDHPYGHERLECVAAIVLATVLAVTGLAIGYSAVVKIVSGEVENMIIPGALAMVAAILSIVVKEAMFQYTKYHAKRIDSGALMADAWHHRSDALSSIGALIGIGGARLGYPVLEPVASIVICLFIAKAAYDIFADAVGKMVDKACDEDLQNQIRQCVEMQTGVLGIDMLQTRMFGNKIYVDVEIRVDGEMKLIAAHEIAEKVHDSIEEQFSKVKHIMVHVNPGKDNRKED